MFFKRSKRNKPAVLKIKSSDKRRVPVNQLYPGMFVAELDIPWEDSPFLFQGFKLQNWEDVDSVAKHCKEVIIDFDQTERINLQRRDFDNDESGFNRKVNTTRQEIDHATNVFEQTSSLVRNIMDDIRLGNVIDTNQTKDSISETVDSIMRTPDAMMMLTRIRETDENTAQHSMNAAVLSIAFGKALGLERKKLVELGISALLHDVGKVLTPQEILTKPEKLTEEEFEIVKRHTRDGRDILASNGNLPPGAIDVAYSHHEFIDGSGYPRGLFGHQTTLWTKIVTITDAYDDITNDSPYREAESNITAFKILNAGGKKQFDSFLVTRFISVIGIYPPGSVVTLNTGESGVVIETNPGHALAPVVAVMRDAEGAPIEPKVIDLALKETIPNGDVHYKIQSVLRQRESDIDMRELKKSGFLVSF